MADPNPDPSPLALQLAARVEKLTPPTAEAVCTAAVLATIALLDDERSKGDGEWSEAVDAWNGARIRKLVRRGRASAWERAQEVPGVTVMEPAEVRAFVPGPMDEAPPGLAKLQIQSTPLEEPDPTEMLGDDLLPHHDRSLDGRGTLMVALTPEHAMSWGKRAAQSAHAGQRLWERLTADRHTVWTEQGRPVRVIHAGPELWAQLRATAEDGDHGMVDIHDGGFTEIPAGTLTALAWWSARLREG